MKWPRELRHPIFLVGTGLYIVVAMYKYGGPVAAQWPVLPRLLRAYLGDALALPLELTLMLYAMRHWYFRRPEFVLPTSWIFSFWLVTSVWFEGILPHYDARATADPLDVVAYALGGLIFWRWMNQPARPIPEP
ncbi:hypothetical protein HMJ29_18875 [Hymenobacter taeanensis]|uniref:Magnesium citrate secondary transporter n=1 Tax=Hymenobacter taeanensis TaxID=2735321 RepID=A0A6M6BLR0_9BACT|nr:MULTISPECIES: hypothetical protein [Hymenobacter]QJX48860.1 hypothetical protein HMJ29_18875 [Hymenobacter taeanensis]UOQ81628.1 hypothetical protein MUN83_02180 [Hymenobacter sp. 5414T-23]